MLVSPAALALAAVVASAPGQAADRLPRPEDNLVLSAPITTWDEAIPLGSGLLGGLLWGEGGTLRLSLDRGDLWDERPAAGVPWKRFNYATMQQLVREGKNDELNAIFDRPYGAPHPTKLPAGRLEVDLAPGRALKSFELNLATAEGRALLDDGSRADAFFSAREPVALLRIPGPEPARVRLMAPLDVCRASNGGVLTGPESASVNKLGYPEAVRGEDSGFQWTVQEAADGLRYCPLVGSRRAKDQTLLAVTVTSTKDGPDPLALARKRVTAALNRGYARMLKPHAGWWAKFWGASSVTVPDETIEKHYLLVRYFYGAASRRGAPPMPLQGVWTADSGGLPPWKGDYHNDLNTQMTYIAYQEAGHFEEGAAYLDFLWNLLLRFRRFARDFYGAPGAAVPGVMSLAGEPLGGWGHYSLSPTMGAWSAHLFYLHWRYTADRTFLRDRAYPWCREIGECLQALLKPDANGVLKLPISTSPEIYENGARAWLKPNTNYDLACLKMLFLSLEEMANALGHRDAADGWARTAAALGDFHLAADGSLKLDAEQDLAESHRHLSNLMPLHPFNLITTDGGVDEHRTIRASTAQWDKLGTSAWVGFSFSWMACLRARAGDAEAALRNLDIFTKAFVLRNGFHANGDQTRSGFAAATYRPFTLEGNFLAMQAVHEMLLQSWDARPGTGSGTIRLFPAMPWSWHDASFEDLRAEGGHRVSARRRNNATIWFRIVAAPWSEVRIRDNFGGRVPHWVHGKPVKEGNDYVATLWPGEVLEATLPEPAAPPAPPADLAQPVQLRATPR